MVRESAGHVDEFVSVGEGYFLELRWGVRVETGGIYGQKFHRWDLSVIELIA